MQKKMVLVCPLNWGLGHATRDIQLIEALLENGFEVVIGADKAPLLLLRQHFTGIPFVIMPSKPIEYSNKAWKLPFKMLVQIPQLVSGMMAEHRFLADLLKTDPFDIVISDNRYGLWNKKVHSIFITHQINIQLPSYLKWAERLIRLINKRLISKFNECWIPDFEGVNSLSGILSHPPKLSRKALFTGTLSRFSWKNENYKANGPIDPEFDMLFILSGPEPQRSLFEKLILTQIQGLKSKALIVLGKPENQMHAQSGNIHMVSHLESKQMAHLIRKTPIVVSRSGYSSIMDFYALKKNAILVPTPGQTEQEYLARYHMQRNWFLAIKQSEFNVSELKTKFQNFRFEAFPENPHPLNQIVANLK